MEHFCECQSKYVLKKNPDTNNYENYCSICEKFVPKDGPILYEIRNIRKNEKKNINKIQAAIYDETFMTAKKPCPSCKYPELRFLLDESMKRIYVCPECKQYW